MNWGSYKNTVDRVVLRNDRLSDDTKRSMITRSLTEELKKKWTLCQRPDSCIEAWMEFAKQYDDPGMISVHLSSLVSEMPHVKDKFDVENLEKLLEDVIMFEKALKSLGLENDTLALTFNGSILSHLWAGKDMKLSNVCKSIGQIVDAVKDLY